jgi:hypothetical protein
MTAKPSANDTGERITQRAEAEILQNGPGHIAAERSAGQLDEKLYRIH